MNKAFYVVLILSMLLILSVSVYLIYRKAPPQLSLSNQLGFTQIYTPKPGGKVFTAMDISGENCESDGIRFNIANEHTLVDRESTWIFTLNKAIDPQSCTDKPWWSPKIGSHGNADQASGLYEASVPYDVDFVQCVQKDPIYNIIHVVVINMLTFHQFHKENQLA
jgi:hypothetical protein